MKKLVPLFILSGVMTVMASCEKVIGDGPVVTETRNISNFSGVDLRVSGNVYFTQAPEYKVEVHAQQNILGVLETYVANNRLVIRFDNDFRVRRHENVTVYISAPDLNNLRVSGSGDIMTTGPLTPGSMEMDISGSGSITVNDLETDYLDATISGSGDIKVLRGSADEEKLRISGSGDMDLANILAKYVSTATSGSGDIRVHATDRLNVVISGSGSVYYRGQPSVNTKISGSGKVTQL